MRASKFYTIYLMSSISLQDRILDLRRILKENPTINDKTGEKQIPALVDELEELLANIYARRNVEDELESRIQERRYCQ